MAYRDMPGSGMFGNIRTTEAPPGMNKAPGSLPISSQTPKKEEEDNCTANFCFNYPYMYHRDKEVMSTTQSQQLPVFGTMFYNQAYPVNRLGVSPYPCPPSFPGSLNSGFNVGFQPQAPAKPMAVIGPQGGMGQSQKPSTLPQVYGRATEQITNSMSGDFSFPTPRSSSSVSHASYDLSDFPSLVNRNLPPSTSLPSGPSYVEVLPKQSAESVPEFNITQEDFPALPGTQNPPSTNAAPVRKNEFQGAFQMSSMSAGDFHQVNCKAKGGAGPSRLQIQTHPGTVFDIPKGMVSDHFGIAGLLSYLQAAETDPELTELARGVDLTTLSPNLNSPKSIYSTFQSPWSDRPCRPQDIDYYVPQEYFANAAIRKRLPGVKLNRFGEDVLFFLFYMNGGDVLQLAAAAELYSRDWRYHKEERLWLIRPPGSEPAMKGDNSERGTYHFFDPNLWQKFAKEFLLEYDKLEEMPTFPSTADPFAI